MRIGFCTLGDPNSKKTWSGSIYFLKRQLEIEGFELILLGPLPNASAVIGRHLEKLILKITGRNFDYMHFPLTCKEFARRLDSKLKESKVQAIFSPCASVVTAYLGGSVPVVSLDDATVNNLINFYPYMSNLHPVSIKLAKAVDAKAFQRASDYIYASTWAAESATNSFPQTIDKIHVIPFGANLEQIPDRTEVLERRFSRKPHHLQLLFVGVEWERKGGPIAFETMKLLNEWGISTKLVVCGCLPPTEFRNEHTILAGFIDKDSDSAKLAQLYLESDFFLLPSRQECAGVVFCEAAAFGLPSIATRVGGIPTYIDHEDTGYTLPSQASATEYARTIANIWHDRKTYERLCLSAREKFDSTLNWDVSGRKIAQILRRYE